MVKFKKIVTTAAFVGGLAWIVSGSNQLDASNAGWRTLASPQAIWPGGGAFYYSFVLPNGSRANLIVVDLKSRRWRIRPALSMSTTAPTSQIARDLHASAAVNGGFFNLSDGVSASYVFINGKAATDPPSNKALVDNPKLKPFLPSVFDRSEIRFLRVGDGRTSVKIVRHSKPLPGGSALVDSLQAGPRLLPTVDDADEAFVRVDPESGAQIDAIGARKTAARTAFGITPDGHALMLAVAGGGQDPESSGITLQELSQLLSKLGCREAINLDGGASTTMYVKLMKATDNPDSTTDRAGGSGEAGFGAETGTRLGGTVVCGKKNETRVKSILLLEPIQKP
jgi:hypothetical protein